jgi:hypothetical protein
MSHILHLHHRSYIKLKIMSSTVLCPTNSTQSSALYKLTAELAGWLAKKMTRSSVIYKFADEAYNQEPSKLVDRIHGRCFMCLSPSHFFPSIYLGGKWDICYKCEYIGPSFPSFILSQIFVSLFPELYLSCHLFIFSKMSGCAGRRACEFTFVLVLLYHNIDRPLPHSIPRHFSDHGFPVHGL